MKRSFSSLLRPFLAITVLLTGAICHGQLTITPNSSAQALAQKLVGDGVRISNVTLKTATGSIVPTGFFVNSGRTNIGIDSGIVLTNGRAKSGVGTNGLDGNGSTTAISTLANSYLRISGDADLSALVNGRATNDAVVLEFDFVPLGDSIKFNYVFSSEEYPEYGCASPPNDYFDVFGFFISGPGFPVKKNIALIPGTNTEVSIHTINDQFCSLYPQYYVDNTANRNFNHNGHTVILTAAEKVTPCETYHLKIAIADVIDGEYDSGVFLQARSLSSNIITIKNQTQEDAQGNSYVVEGCTNGAFEIRRARKDPTPLSVALSYIGTAINGTDVQLLPSSVTIPANDSIVVVNVNTVIDNMPEGIETIKVYALAGCIAGTPTDSTTIQIRDYDILSLSPDTAFICRNSSLQLMANTGYTTYQWDANASLNSTVIHNPFATPVNNSTTYICTATIGTCNARDSVFVKWKDVDLVSKTDVNCRNGNTGKISVNSGAEWTAPVQYSLDGINWQASGDFINLPVGNYSVKAKDADCIDSMNVSISQAFPDLLIDNTTISAANCSGNPDGQLTVAAIGGNDNYSYSVNGINFQSSNLFNLLSGNYTVTLKDNNGCTDTKTVTIPLNDTLTLDASDGTTICEGASYIIPAISNAQNFTWTSTAAMSGASTLNPTASPVTTAWYYVLAKTGICSRNDSVKINVLPAPVPDAGDDISICVGKTLQLNGSGGVSYQWTPGTHFISATDIQSPDVKARENITYYLSVVDANGCPSLQKDDINIRVTPAVKIFAGKDTVAAINQPIQLMVIETGNSGVIKYSWSPGNFLSDPNSHDPIATLPFDQRYVVTGTTADGCEGTDDIMIKVYKGPEIYVPSGFTPDNNGLNDVLKAIPVGIKEFRYFNVYNRWGQLIFSTKDPSKGWDGKINGVAQITGTYAWISEGIDFTGKQVFRKGTVTIIR